MRLILALPLGAFAAMAIGEVVGADIFWRAGICTFLIMLVAAVIYKYVRVLASVEELDRRLAPPTDSAIDQTRKE